MVEVVSIARLQSLVSSVMPNKKKANHPEKEEIEANLFILDEHRSLLVNVFSLNQCIYLSKVH